MYSIGKESPRTMMLVSVVLVGVVVSVVKGQGSMSALQQQAQLIAQMQAQLDALEARQGRCPAFTFSFCSVCCPSVSFRRDIKSRLLVDRLMVSAR